MLISWWKRLYDFALRFLTVISGFVAGGAMVAAWYGAGWTVASLALACGLALLFAARWSPVLARGWTNQRAFLAQVLLHSIVAGVIFVLLLRLQ